MDSHSRTQIGQDWQYADSSSMAFEALPSLVIKLKKCGKVSAQDSYSETNGIHLLLWARYVTEGTVAQNRYAPGDSEVVCYNTAQRFQAPRSRAEGIRVYHFPS